jgi:hypothetical protein
MLIFKPFKMNDELLALAKNDKDTKAAIKEKMIKVKDMNTATRAELATKLLIDSEVIRSALNIAGDTIYDLSVDNEILNDKNNELKKHLTSVERNKIDDMYKDRKEHVKANDDRRVRILGEIRKTLSKNKQLTQ